MQKDFDAINYLVKKYVDDGEHATIPLILKTKTDFFNKYDPTHTSISPDVYNYLDKCSYNIPANYKIRIDVVCNDMDDETKNDIEEAVRNHYGLKVFDNNIDIKASNRKASVMAAFGIIFVIFAYMWDNIGLVNQIVGTAMNVLKEVLIVTGWVFIWSSIEKVTFDRRELAERRRDNIQMLNAVFLFENEKQYYKILEEEEKEKVEENEEYEEIRDSFLEQ